MTSGEVPNPTPSMGDLIESSISRFRARRWHDSVSLDSGFDPYQIANATLDALKGSGVDPEVLLETAIRETVIDRNLVSTIISETSVSRPKGQTETQFELVLASNIVMEQIRATRPEVVAEETLRGLRRGI